MANSNPPHVDSVKWSKDQADIGEEVTLTANLVSIKDGTSISFVISEYSGKPPQDGGGFEETEITTVTGTAKDNKAEAKWKVTFSAENGVHRGLPEFRFRAKKGDELGTASTLLTLGEVTEVSWIDPDKDKSLASGVRSTQAYFKDTEEVTMSVKATGLKGISVNFLVSARNAMGVSSFWEQVYKKEDVAFTAGKAEAKFNIKQSDLQAKAFGSYKFAIELSYKGTKNTPGISESGIARHYASILGIWGAGPDSDGYSNNVINQIAAAVNGVAMGRKNSSVIKRIAQQISPDATGFKVFGYSRGGVALGELCSDLSKRNVPVALAIGIDPVAITGNSVPLTGNVQAAKCYYQRNGAKTIFLPSFTGKGDPFSSVGGGGAGIVNEEITPAVAGKIVYHEGMPDFVVDHRNIVADLQ